MKIGILTSGGDCAGLNSVMRGIGPVCVSEHQKCRDRRHSRRLQRPHPRRMPPHAARRVRAPARRGRHRARVCAHPLQDDDRARRRRLHRAWKRCAPTTARWGWTACSPLGGAGTHRTAALLCAEGYNVIGLPKTIDNDIYGTDYTFGFHTALDVVTDAIERVRTTADSHGRTILVEVMGNKAGWLTLFSGIAGGADAIILPEIPFNIDKIVECVQNTYASGKRSCVIAIAEGAVLDSEAPFKRRERAFIRLDRGEATATRHLAEIVGERTGAETRGTRARLYPARRQALRLRQGVLHAPGQLRRQARRRRPLRRHRRPRRQPDHLQRPCRHRRQVQARRSRKRSGEGGGGDRHLPRQIAPRTAFIRKYCVRLAFCFGSRMFGYAPLAKPRLPCLCGDCRTGRGYGASACARHFCAASIEYVHIIRLSYKEFR